MLIFKCLQCHDIFTESITKCPKCNSTNITATKITLNPQQNELLNKIKNITQHALKYKDFFYQDKEALNLLKTIEQYKNNTKWVWGTTHNFNDPSLKPQLVTVTQTGSQTNPPKKETTQ